MAASKSLNRRGEKKKINGRERKLNESPIYSSWPALGQWSFHSVEMPYNSQPTRGWGKHGGLNLNLGRLFQPRAQFLVGSGALLVEGQDDGTGVGSERAWRGEVTDTCWAPTSAKHCALYNLWVDLHNNPSRWQLFMPHLKGEEGPERVSILPKVTERVSSKIRMWPQPVWPPNPYTSSNSRQGWEGNIIALNPMRPWLHNYLSFNLRRPITPFQASRLNCPSSTKRQELSVWEPGGAKSQLEAGRRWCEH